MTTQSAFWLHVFPSNFMLDIVKYIPIEDLCHWLASIMSTRKSFMTFIDENMDKFWQDRQWHTRWNQLESIFLRYPILFRHIKKLPNSFSLVVKRRKRRQFVRFFGIEDIEPISSTVLQCLQFVSKSRKLDVELSDYQSDFLYHLLKWQSRVKWLIVRCEANVLRSITRPVGNKHLLELTLIFNNCIHYFQQETLYGKISCLKLKTLTVNDMVFIRKTDGLFSETTNMHQVKNAIACLVPYFDIKFPMEEVNQFQLGIPLEFVIKVFPNVKRLIVQHTEIESSIISKYHNQLSSINEMIIYCNSFGWMFVGKMYLESKFPNLIASFFRQTPTQEENNVVMALLTDMYHDRTSLISSGFDFERIFSILYMKDHLLLLLQHVFENQFVKRDRWIVSLSENEEVFTNIVNQYGAVVEEENVLMKNANRMLDEIKTKIQYYYRLNTKYVYKNSKVFNGMNELVKEMERHMEEMGLNPSILHSKQRRAEVLEEELPQKKIKPSNGQVK